MPQHQLLWAHCWVSHWWCLKDKAAGHSPDKMHLFDGHPVCFLLLHCACFLTNQHGWLIPQHEESHPSFGTSAWAAEMAPKAPNFQQVPRCPHPQKSQPIKSGALSFLRSTTLFRKCFELCCVPASFKTIHPTNKEPCLVAASM